MDYRTHFVPLVQAYITLIETAATRTDYALLLECVRLLPQLYAWGYRLPDISPPDLDDIQTETVEMTRPLFARFGRYAHYRLVFDPLVDTDIVIAHIADDLADIYHDLKHPLIRFEQGENTAQQLAIWEWQFTLRGHSGTHIVNVLRPIHIMLNVHMDPDDGGISNDKA